MDTRSRSSNNMRPDWDCVRTYLPKQQTEHYHFSSSGLISLDTRSITGYRGVPDRTSVHPCTHVVASHSAITQRFRYENDKTWGDIFRFDISLFTAPTSISVSLPSFSDSQLDAALTDLRGEIPTEVLLPNFIIELPEALELHSQLIEAFRGVRDWVSAGARYAKKAGKSCANTHLLYQFGLKPLASDLVTLWSLSSRIRKRLQYLSRIPSGEWSSWRKHIRTDKSATVSVSFPEFCLSYRAETDSCICDASLFARVKRWRTVGTVTDSMLAALDASGFSKPGKVLWEAIPFSFVADWFYPCGDVLDSLNVTAFESCLLNQKVGYQHSTWAQYRCYGKPSSMIYGGLDTSGQEKVLGAGTVRRYERVPGFPPTQTEINFGMRQSLLSGSLALQRL